MLVYLLNVMLVVPTLAEMENVVKMLSTDIPIPTIYEGVNWKNIVDVNSTSTKANFLLYDYLIPGIGLLIILLNLTVVVSSGLILKKGQEPRSTYLFLGNVAMADLVTGVAVIFSQFFPMRYRDHYVCAVQLGMIVSSCVVSVYSVGLIGVDRFLYILHGMQYQRWVYPNRARLLICLAWCIGLVIGFLPVMGWHGDIADTDNGKICWFLLLFPKELIALAVVISAIPMIVVAFLYSIILYHALKKIIQIQQQARNCNNTNTQENISSGNIRMFRGRGNNSQNEENPEPEPKGIFKFLKKKPSSSVKSPSKWKAIKVVLFTTVSFFITWYPFLIANLIYVFSCDLKDTNKQCQTMRSFISSPLTILGIMNGFLNPVIYAWWHKGFRTFFKKKVFSMVLHRRRADDAINSASQSKSTSSKNIPGSSSDNNVTPKNKYTVKEEE